MTIRAVSWGLLVSAALPALSGCSAAPPPAVAPPIEPVSSAPPPAPPPAPSVPLGLGPVNRLSPEDAPLAPSTRSFPGFQAQRAFFGRGSFVALSMPGWSRAPNNCPILDTKDLCSVFTLTVTDQDPADERWRTGEAPSRSVARTISAPVPAAWAAFSGGHDAIYAFPGSAPNTIDQINDKGEVRPFLVSDTVAEWARLAVVEVGERRFVIGHSDSAPLQVAEALPDGSDRPRKLGTPTELGMAPVPGYRKSAQGARQIEETKKRPMYGPLVAVPTRDDKAARDGWALVWVEALPPPFGWPADKPYKRRGRHDCGGGPTSRSLSVKSVEKRFHVTRFDGTRQVSDRVVLSSQTFDEDFSPFLVRGTDKGVELNGVTYDRGGKSVETREPKAPERKPEVMAPDEQVLATAFDPASNRGAVVFWSGDRAFWRTFDGQGKPTNKATALAGDPSKGFALYDGSPVLSASAGGWWLSDLAEAQLLSLDRGTLAAAPPNWVVGFFPGGDTPSAFQVDNGLLSRRRFDPKTGVFAEQTEPVETQRTDFPSATPVLGANSEPSFVAVQPAKEGSPMTLIRLTPSSGQWSEIPGSIPEEIGSFRQFTLHQVWGDVVLWAEGAEGFAATWLRAGKTRVYPNKGAEGAANVVGELPRGGLFGPLVRRGASMLPSRPGALIETPELEEIGQRCEYLMPTAPGTLTLLCTEALFKDKAGTRVGIQTYHFRE
jgi:hypothetical protein